MTHGPTHAPEQPPAPGRGPSRVARGRDAARVLKAAAALGAAGAFGAVALLAQSSHPARATGGGDATLTTPANLEDRLDSGFFGRSDLAPAPGDGSSASTGAPQVRTRTS